MNADLSFATFRFRFRFSQTKTTKTDLAKEKLNAWNFDPQQTLEPRPIIQDTEANNIEEICYLKVKMRCCQIYLVSDQN